MHLDAHGVSLHVQTLGERGGATDVVMLHGLLLGSLASWYFTVAPELARSRRAILYDLRGHGLSATPSSGYDVRTMAEDLREVIDRVATSPVDLVGHSYGALIALRFALDHDDLVRRVVLVEAPLPPSSFHELDGFVSSSPAQMVEALPESMRAIVARGGRKATRFVQSIHRLANETSLLTDLRAETDIDDAELARLDRPVLVAVGDRSSCKDAGDRLARVLPNATLATLGGGHYLHLDAPAALRQNIEAFLDG